METPQKISVSIRIDKADAEELSELALEDGRTFSSLVGRILKDYLQLVHSPRRAKKWH